MIVVVVVVVTRTRTFVLKVVTSATHAVNTEQNWLSTPEEEKVYHHLVVEDGAAVGVRHEGGVVVVEGGVVGAGRKVFLSFAAKGKEGF